VNLQHARRYAEVQAQLDTLQAAGSIVGYAAQPEAYAFAVEGPDARALTALRTVGSLQPLGELSAAAIDGLDAAYQKGLAATIAASVAAITPHHPQTAVEQPLFSQPSVTAAALRANQNASAAAPGGHATGSVGTAGLGTTGANPLAFRIQLYDSIVYGNITDGTVVTATLTTAAGAFKGSDIQTASAGWVSLELRDLYGNPVPVNPTDILQVQMPHLVTIPVVTLHTSIDGATRKATGVAPSNVTSQSNLPLPNLYFTLAPSGWITTTPSGTFAVDTLDASPGRRWDLSFTNAEYQQTILSGQQPVLVLRGSYWDDAGIYRSEDFVSGAVLRPNAVLTVTLTRAGSPPIVNFARSDAEHTFGLRLHDLYGNPVAILAGDTVQVVDGGVTTLTVTAPAFDVVSDAAAGTISGSTTAVVLTDTVTQTQTLAVWPLADDDFAKGSTVLLTGNTFNVGNPFCDLADRTLACDTVTWHPGDWGHLRYRDAQGNLVYAQFRARAAAPILALRGLDAYEDDARAYVTVDVAGTGSVELYNAAGTLKSRSFVEGADTLALDFVDAYGNPLPISGGDTVVASFHGMTATVTAPPLAMTADPVQETVSGQITPGLVTTTTADAPGSLAIYAPGASAPVYVLPAPNGSFTAAFTGTADILPGSAGYALYRNTSGAKVFAAWTAPFAKPVLGLRGTPALGVTSLSGFSSNFFAGGYIADNYVEVDLAAFSCDSRKLDLIVRAADNRVRWQQALPVCGLGVEVPLTDPFGRALPLQAGDTVSATFDGQTTTARVPAFTVVSDAQAQVVAGTTDAAVATTTVGLTQTLAVWPADTNDSGIGKYTLAAGGNFSVTNPFYPFANPSNLPQELQWAPGAHGQLRYLDAEGNAIYADFTALVDAPLLYVGIGTNWIDGITPAGSVPVTVTVKSGAAVKGVGYVTADRDGEFYVTIYDGQGNPIQIAAGDQIEMTPPLTTVIAPPLSANVDVDADRVWGTGPANALLNLRLLGLFVSSPRYGFTVATDDKGAYAIDLRGILDIQPFMRGMIEYRDPAGHEFAAFRMAGSHVAAGLNTSRVWGWGLDAGALGQLPGQAAAPAPLQVTVQRSGAVAGRGEVQLGMGGYFIAFVRTETGQPLLLQAGDVVTVDFGGGVQRTLTLSALQLAIDLGRNVLQGTGPAASLIEVATDAQPFPGMGVNAAAHQKELEETVLTDATGRWGLDLNLRLFQLLAGDAVYVRHAAAAGDMTWLPAAAPFFMLRANADNEVRGYATPWSPVTVTLLRNGGVLAVTQTETGWDGRYHLRLRDANGLLAPIRAGDVVEVRSAQAPTLGAAVSTTRVTVPPMTAVVDETTRTVTGVGPASAAMGLLTDGGDDVTVLTGPDGAFQAVFPQAQQIGYVTLRYREPGGNWIYAATGAPVAGPRYLAARYDGMDYLPYAVSGAAGVAQQAVTVTLRRGNAAAAAGGAMASSDGSFVVLLRDAAGNFVSILPGDLLELAAGGVTTSFTVPAATAQVNLASKTLFGTGPAGAEVADGGLQCRRNPFANGQGGGVIVDGGGNWVLPCGDLELGDTGSVFFTEASGNRTYVNWSTPYVTVRLYGNQVSGITVPQAEIQLALRRGEGAAAAVVATATVQADASNGWFRAAFFGPGGLPFLTQPGDTLLATYGGQTISVPLVALAAAADVATEKVSGAGPAGAALEVSVEDDLGRAEVRPVTANAAGQYTADFAGAFDVAPGAQLQVMYRNADGNNVQLVQRVPLVRINLSSDIVDGFAVANGRAALALIRGGATVATAEAATDAEGAFSAFFLDGQGNVIDLLPGDTVQVGMTAASAAGVTEAAVPAAVTAGALALTVALDAATDSITGNGPAGAPILIVAYRCAAGYCQAYATTVIAGSDGRYAAQLAGIFELDATSYAYAQARDAGGNLTSATTVPAETPQLAAIEEQLQGAGATVLLGFAGTANGGNLTPPQRFNVVGAGKLIFVATGGALVVTAPDGSVLRASDGYLNVANPLSGEWQVQVLIAGPGVVGPDALGDQYAVAVGQGLYTVYMPIVKQRQ
jgi:hypothetical protein